MWLFPAAGMAVVLFTVYLPQHGCLYFFTDFPFYVIPLSLELASISTCFLFQFQEPWAAFVAGHFIYARTFQNVDRSIIYGFTCSDRKLDFYRWACLGVTFSNFLGGPAASICWKGPDKVGSASMSEVRSTGRNRPAFLSGDSAAECWWSSETSRLVRENKRGTSVSSALFAAYLMVTVCVCSLNKRNGRTHGRRNKCFDTHLTEMASCKSIRPAANRILADRKAFSPAPVGKTTGCRHQRDWRGSEKQSSVVKCRDPIWISPNPLDWPVLQSMRRKRLEKEGARRNDRTSSRLVDRGVIGGEKPRPRWQPMAIGGAVPLVPDNGNASVGGWTTDDEWVAERQSDTEKQQWRRMMMISCRRELLFFTPPTDRPCGDSNARIRRLTKARPHFVTNQLQ